MKSSKLLKSLRVDDPDRFSLASFDPSGTAGLAKRDAEPMLAADIKRLRALQERLYADHRWAMLVVLQGMDTAGKDGVVKHVMTGVNPQGCDVHPFKAPNEEELDHDFLWRAALRLPRRGHIGVFNRSYYEETLVCVCTPKCWNISTFPGGSSGSISGRSASTTSAASNGISRGAA
jgi:polyphosphate kinase 2 (PPK2 family)